MEQRETQFERQLKLIFNNELIANHQYKEYNQCRVRNITQLKFMKDDIDKFNKAVKLVHSNKLNKIARTSSGSISNTLKYKLNNKYAYDIRHSTSRVSLTIICGNNVYNIVVGKPKELREIEPIKAWNKFIEICNDFNINFDDYKITKEEGKSICEEIKSNKDLSPMISMKYNMSENDELLDNVHHIDIHSSYPSGLVKMYPEFKPVIEYIYNKRKEDGVYKAIMNYTISGCTMSKYSPWYRQWSHIAKFVRENNNKNVKYLSWLLTLNGREVIGYNTDGIWYRGEIFHKSKDNIITEGHNYGQWENDYVNCKFRSRSDGAYEFIENGKYHPVLRGLTKLDIIEPDRSKWQLGDIYRYDISEFYYDEDSELIKEIKDEKKI